MTYRKAKIIYNTLFFIIAILPVSCFKSLTTTNVVYENNFEAYQLNTVEVSGWNATNTGFGPVGTPRIRNYNGNNVLGQLNSNLVQLKLVNLPSHQALRVEFDLYIHNNWKNGLWHMTLDGRDQWITGFSNDSTIAQSYPNWLNGPLSPAGRDAEDIYLPGTCSFVGSLRGTSKYRMITTISHTDPIFTLGCNDAGGINNDTCTRSWSIDNLKVSVFKN